MLHFFLAIGQGDGTGDEREPGCEGDESTISLQRVAAASVQVQACFGASAAEGPRNFTVRCRLMLDYAGASCTHAADRVLFQFLQSPPLRRRVVHNVASSLSVPPSLPSLAMSPTATMVAFSGSTLPLFLSRNTSSLDQLVAAAKGATREFPQLVGYPSSGP
jgi:hypothetical protein